MERLPDILRPGLDVVFCGTAAGATSAARGHYYAGPGNKFWRMLFVSGLTPRLLRPEDDHAVLDFGLGLTDLNKIDAGSDAGLKAAHFDVAGFVARIAGHGPRRVAFNGKAAAEKAHGRKLPTGTSGLLGWTIAGARVWVLPSSSGAANGHWDEGPWHALAADVRGLAAPPGMG